MLIDDAAIPNSGFFTPHTFYFQVPHKAFHESELKRSYARFQRPSLFRHAVPYPSSYKACACPDCPLQPPLLFISHCSVYIKYIQQLFTTKRKKDRRSSLLFDGLFKRFLFCFSRLQSIQGLAQCLQSACLVFYKLLLFDINLSPIVMVFLPIGGLRSQRLFIG